jgi:Asp-tRNA(Asn)/Glu-tRNA(Gln) amidotransferase A subunit family amidase
MDAVELCYLPATGLVTAIKAKDVSPVGAVDAALARIECLNPMLKASCAITAKSARAAANEAEVAAVPDDPLGAPHSVAVSIKDLGSKKSVRTIHGSKRYGHFNPDGDAPVVERLNMRDWRSGCRSSGHA